MVEADVRGTSVIWRGGVMIDRCANPACSRRFRYLHEGKLFAFDVYGKATTGDGRSEFASRPHAVEFFWLCNECYSHGTLMTSSREAVRGVVSRSTVEYRTNFHQIAESTLEKQVA